MADLYFFFSGRDKWGVVGNIRAIFAYTGRTEKGKDGEESYRCAREVFRNFARYLVDFFLASRIDAAYIERCVKIEGIERLDCLLREGKGVIVVTAHMGNWELGAMVTGRLGYPLHAIALAHDNRRINRIFLSRRADNGVQVIPVGMAVKQCFSILSRGGLLALLGDHDFFNSGIEMPLFGKPMRIPRGPARLALKTGASILPAFMVREREDRYRLIFDEPIRCSPSGTGDGDGTTELTRRITAVIEQYIGRYPDQWFMFNRFWSGK